MGLGPSCVGAGALYSPSGAGFAVVSLAAVVVVVSGKSVGAGSSKRGAGWLAAGTGAKVGLGPSWVGAGACCSPSGAGPSTVTTVLEVVESVTTVVVPPVTAAAAVVVPVVLAKSVGAGRS